MPQAKEKPTNLKSVNISSLSWSFSYFTPTECEVKMQTTPDKKLKPTFKTSTPATLFKTASDKSINLSEKSLLKAECMLESDSLNLSHVKNNKPSHRLKSIGSPNSGLKKSNSANSDTKTQVNFFKTASNKQLKVSDRALKKAEKIVAHNIMPNTESCADNLAEVTKKLKFDECLTDHKQCELDKHSSRNADCSITDVKVISNFKAFII